MAEHESEKVTPSSRFREQSERAYRRLAALPPGSFVVTRPLVASKRTPPGRSSTGDGAA